MRSSPPSSSQPIEPPPAPMVWMSSIGSAILWRAISPSFFTSGAPTATDASKLVPPMSVVMQRSRPSACA